MILGPSVGWNSLKNMHSMRQLLPMALVGPGFVAGATVSGSTCQKQPGGLGSLVKHACALNTREAICSTAPVQRDSAVWLRGTVPGSPGWVGVAPGS